MQILALYDRKGRILAAVQLKTTKSASLTPQPRPQAKPGQTLGTFTVPSEYAHLEFVEVCKKMRVQTKGKIATLAVADSKPSKTNTKRRK